MLLGTTSEKGIGKSSNNPGAQAMRHVCGLLEVEPLHFICHATSDGTRMERMDTGMVSSILTNFTFNPYIMTNT